MNIIANVLSIAACIVMVASGFLKKKNHILWSQNVQFSLLGVSYFLLGAFSGSISNAIGVIRNIVLPKVSKPLGWKIGFITVQFLLTYLAWDGQTWQAWIPLLNAVMLTVVLNTKSVVLLKVVIMIVQGTFCVFDFHYGNYGAMAADILTILTTGYSIPVVIRENRKAKETVQ